VGQQDICPFSLSLLGRTPSIKPTFDAIGIGAPTLRIYKINTQFFYPYQNWGHKQPDYP